MPLSSPALPPQGFKQRLRNVPVLGTLLAWLNAFARLPETRARLARLEARQAQAHDTETPAGMDAFYVAFEDRFRGSREDIKQRQSVYLPHVSHLRGSAGGHAVAVDIGCGRGEWLELMREQGIAALGVDGNGAMVEACRARGLAAECADAVDFLRRQPAGSLGLITGFHIIEHIPFTALVALFDAAAHALRDDGCVIFETPNPENLRVGACSFHTDPTHLKPIVPDVAEFIARARGFAEAEIVRLHPHPAHEQLADAGATAAAVNAALFGPRDYAVLAWKRRRPAH